MTSHMPPRLIDFHSHYYDEGWLPIPPPLGTSNLARAWPLLTDIEAQLAAMEVAGIDAKVVSAPVSTIVSPVEQLPPILMERINDQIATLIARYPERLLGIATIDAFQGKAAAREVERAVQQLGLRGICVDSSQGGHYLDAAEARPTLEAAAALGVSIFVHPVNPSGLTERLAPLGGLGGLLARGTENAASILTLLRSGILEKLPTLRLVLPMIGAGALLFAGLADMDYERDDSWKGTPPSELRQRLYIDTMGFDPAAIRFALEVVGSEHVVIGSDWPVMPITTRRRIDDLLAALKLTEEQKACLLSGNTERLLTSSVEQL
ncbi:amidohydrolase family protein [Dictyobacter arantiisoli]|uniref:Amidohydrolase n=1 Tax=Dictyobacter arantiisoli TaxID=2014874 RepID=A0A5A5T6P3_9CHLR|nr:amidohydrolase family protein [Dictyobacter arantiisoli]GCF06905.1 amidohydrolase [Dictyobacter arantiisoli]